MQVLQSNEHTHKPGFISAARRLQTVSVFNKEFA